jgi:hypothetical protein
MIIAFLGQIEIYRLSPSARFQKAPKSMQFERWKARARKNRNSFQDSYLRHCQPASSQRASSGDRDRVRC